jgi:hypothetical protein
MKQIIVFIMILPIWLFSNKFIGSGSRIISLQEDSSILRYPIVLCAKANKPKLIKDGNPFVFIEFVNEDSAFGYMGSYPYKGSMGYAHQWLFNLGKVSHNNYESEWVHMSNHHKYSIKVFATNGSWYFKEDGFNPLKLDNIYNCGCSDTIRKYIYVESLMNLKYYEKGIMGGKLGRYRYETNPYENEIYKLPFEVLRMKVNAMSLRELHLLFGKDTTGLD